MRQLAQSERLSVMNKSLLLEHIRSFRQQVMSELDRLEDALISLGEPQVQDVQVTQTDGWLNVKQVCEYLNISQTTFYEGVKSGRFPAGVAFGAKTLRWRISDIAAWRAKQEAHQEAAEPAKRRGRPSRIGKIGVLLHV